MSIKPDILKLLEIPFELIYSSIGNLQITVPWKNLSTQPIEVVLQKVYLILSPTKKENWNFQDFKSL